jgi:putative DNA methylase
MVSTPHFKPKLIEVGLPLETINRESAREKSIRHGHPSTLHLWWARRPLAAARAVLFAQLVDDPSGHPDRFPTEEDQRAERERLHKLIERLVVWENIRDEKLLAEARSEIYRSCDGAPPAILDPFAGGGTIPLEAQRLGLEAHASDLNPVAVLINKALIEIPPKFHDQPPVFPGLADSETVDWRGARGLAADVRAYGAWMREQAEQRVGHLYPKATLSDGSKATVIAWIWARTVTCPNPACGIEMPLVRSWWLGKKKGKEAYVVPEVVEDTRQSSNSYVRYRIEYDVNNSPTKDDDGTVGRRGATCVSCDSSVRLAYIREQGRAGNLGAKLIAIVAEGARQRHYINPDKEHVDAADIDRPMNSVQGNLGYYPRDIKALTYGFTQFVDLFTGRQLTTLTTFSDLVSEAREKILKDSLSAGLPEGERLESGSIGAAAYADAVATYLGLSVSRGSDRQSSICTWDASPSKEQVRGVFARQAIPMSWDYAEANPFAKSSGTWTESVDWVAKVLDKLPAGKAAWAEQADATTREVSETLISTDPPYYDNIGYSDLSDFFYVWLRRTLRDIHPRLLSTLLVPKSAELVANAYRHDGAEGAKEFFESGFRQVFANARASANPNFPITVWYAFKQSDDTGEGTSSSGWETLLDGMIRGGWVITATWPNRSELANRMMASGMNALASSIVLALRPRPDGAPTIDRRGLISALQAELPDALRRLQQGAIAPVDLPQAAIGPGMAVFSRYDKVLEADGSAMSVSSALSRINEILDQVLSEQEGDFDTTTRFALAWYRQHGYATGDFGDADNLARARNISVESMDRAAILISRAGNVKLIMPDAMPANYDVRADESVSTWEVLHHAIRILEVDGVPAAGAFLAAGQRRLDGAVDPDLVKELAFLLFSIAEKKGRAKEALSFNAIAQSWGDVITAAQEPAADGVQAEFDYTEAAD